MTKEEILRVLKANLEWQHYTDGNDSWDSELKQAVTEAIKILEQQPSEDCVSKKAVLDCLTATGLKKFDFILDAREKVNNLPPVTPTRKSGLHWIERFDNEDKWLVCPHCHMDSISAYNYCPNCGAEMKGAEDE